MTYEDMHANTAAFMRRLINWIGITKNEEAILNAVELCEFDNMRKLEKSGRVKMKSLNARKLEREEQFKTRNGTPDSWKGQDIEIVSELEQQFRDLND